MNKDGYSVKEKAQQFNSRNGNITYTTKELLKAVHEDLKDLSNDIKSVDNKLDEFIIDNTKEVTKIKTSLSLYKKLSLIMLTGFITLIVTNLIII